jgi:hypothetical protein
MELPKIFRTAKTISKVWSVIFKILITLSYLFIFLDSISKNGFDIGYLLGSIIGIYVGFILIKYFFYPITNLTDFISNNKSGQISRRKFNVYWSLSLICTLLLCVWLITIPTLIPQFICLFKLRQV